MKNTERAYWSVTPDIDLNKISNQFTDAQQEELRQMFVKAREDWKECPEYYKMYDKGKMPRK